MSLTPGTRLGPYEITGAIGAGGMGEVFRARDTKLNRDVAIKVLPAAFADDPQRLARFTREAQTLASLNHPNIATIHGIEEVPAVDGASAGSRALVMELVEGEDLSTHIARGPIPIAEALPIARQIAEALEAAHEQGIVHRDLKPANIKVRADGTVKVLDFGLAKAMDPAGASSADAMHSPTLTARATQMGMIIGTAAYMSPEQAKGKTVDKRTDIWAFGVVLYEMLSGTRAFKGEDVSETLASVLKDELSMDALPTTTPPRLERLIERCLDRDLKTRLRDIGEARVKIARIETGAPESAVSSPALSTATAVPAWRGALPWAMAGAFALIAALAASRAAPVLPEMRTEIVTPVTDEPAMFDLSPDGRQIVFVASGDGASRLWLRLLATTTAQPLAGTEGARDPFWSPDARSIGFFANGVLRRLDLDGGATRTLAPARYGRGGTWTRDGAIFFWTNPANQLMRVSANGGSLTAVKTVSPHSTTYFLPDGKRFVFSGRHGTADAGIHLGAFDGSAPTRLVSGTSSEVYVLPSGWLVWLRANHLVAQRLDVAKAALTGDLVTLADGVAGVSVSTTGLIAYRTEANIRRQLTWMDRSGKNLGTLGESDGSIITPRISPDGRRVAVSRERQGNLDIWLLEGERASRFTVDPAVDRYGVWSPDGARIAFSSGRTGLTDLYVKSADGTGAEERLVADDSYVTASSWSADGRFILYYTFDSQTGLAQMGILPVTGDRKASLVLSKLYNERDPVFSPDGKWVAYQSEESGRPEVYVRAFVPASKPDVLPGFGNPVLVSTAGGVHATWRPDGKELYYLGPRAEMMAAPISVNGSVISPGSPVMLFPTRTYGGGTQSTPLGRQYDVAPDGRFLINTVIDAPPTPITLLQNWNPDVKK
jgi:Tol biopolymer transport system component